MANYEGYILKKHIDYYCGTEPEKFYKEDTTEIGVAKFIDIPDKGLVTYLTIGLSAHILNQKKSQTKIRQELLVCIDKNYDYLPWETILFSGAKIILDSETAMKLGNDSHTAFQLGQVIGPGGPLFPEFPGLRSTALLCSYPAFFDEEFFEIDGMDTPLVLVELIPITSNESSYIHRKGWSTFFDKVNSGEINILDLKRS
jgi:hypothetical protein